MTKPILSILICTIKGREESYSRLLALLHKQITENGLEGQVNIHYCYDKRGEHSIGWKRNQLLQNCDGIWACFIDDDDMVCDDFIKLIVAALKEHNPDVISLEGVLNEMGRLPRKFIHSLKYDSWFEESAVYYRPPNHLNPMRTEISKKFLFQELNHGEDKRWSMAICEAKVLKTEVSIGKPYYFYNFIPNEKKLV